MIPVTAVAVLFSVIDDGVPAGTDAQWPVPLISPGNQADASEVYRAWVKLWVKNGTNQSVDLAVITTLTTNATAVIAAAAKTTFATLEPGDKFVWDFDPADPLAGPIYCRFSAAPPPAPRQPSRSLPATPA